MEVKPEEAVRRNQAPFEDGCSQAVAPTDPGDCESCEIGLERHRFSVFFDLSCTALPDRIRVIGLQV